MTALWRRSLRRKFLTWALPVQKELGGHNESCECCDLLIVAMNLAFAVERHVLIDMFRVFPGIVSSPQFMPILWTQVEYTLSSGSLGELSAVADKALQTKLSEGKKWSSCFESARVVYQKHQLLNRESVELRREKCELKPGSGKHEEGWRSVYQVHQGVKDSYKFHQISVDFLNRNTWMPQ